MKTSLIWSLGTALFFTFFLAVAARGQTDIIPRIINGTPTTAFESVGIVGTTQYGGVATGTLITPSHVLTAGHVGVLVTTPTGGTFELNGQTYTTSHVYVNPNYDSVTDTNDIAIYELSEAIEDVTPSAIFRGTPQVGDMLTLVGYGAGGNGTTGQDGTFGTKLTGTTTIDEVTPTEIIWTFDNNSESDTAYGDSGGPAYLLVNGEYYIAGTTDGGSSPNSLLGDVAYDTRVDAFASWIDSVVASSTSSTSTSGTGSTSTSGTGCTSTSGTGTGCTIGNGHHHPGFPVQQLFPPKHDEHPWQPFTPSDHPWHDTHPDAWTLLEDLFPVDAPKQPTGVHYLDAWHAPERGEGREHGH